MSAVAFVGQQPPVHLDAAVGAQVEVGDARQRQPRAEPGPNLGLVALQEFDDAGADRAEADQSDTNVACHVGVPDHPTSRRCRSAATDSAWRMPRIAWRVRCSFSISAKRT